MVRILAFSVSAAALLGALLSLWSAGGEWAGPAERKPAAPAGRPAASATAVPDPPVPDRGETRRAAAAVSRTSAAAPVSDEDPEAASSRFREEVLRELSRTDPARTRTAAAPGPVRLASTALRRGAGAAAERRRALSPDVDPDGVDWAYLDAVFAGRVSGIPNETRAGLSLVEMDRLGSIPYVEELRAERRLDELRDLGFEDEPGMVPWPVCQRTGTCLRDEDGDPIL